MMDSDDDDIYPEHEELNGSTGQGNVKMEDVEDGEEVDEQVEGERVEEAEDEDDSDVCSMTRI